MRVTALVCLLVGMLWLLLARAGTVHAAGVVTDCSNDNDLDAQLAGGGLVTFNCALPAPIIITVTTGGGIIPAPDTTLNGSNNGNPITLSGGGSTRLFDVMAGVSLTLTNITLTDGNASAGAQGGAILNEGGSVVLDHVAIHRSLSSFAGGAIANISGTMVVADSLIENNQSAYAGGIHNRGTLTLNNTTLISNSANYGGGIYNRGTVTLNNSTLSANTVITDGGGIYNYQGTLMLNDSTLSGNSAQQQGGGIYNAFDSNATLTNVTLSGNSASFDGGGIFNDGTATVISSTLSGNSANRGGGIYCTNGLTLNSSTLSGNSASFGGGGIFCLSGLTVNNSTLSGNSASVAGGGIYNTLGSVTLNNSTLSGNSATQQGGGIYNSKIVRLLNVTLSNNSATAGGALFMLGGHTTVLTNTILAYSPAGGNCGGTISDSKYSISSDNSCALPAGHTIHGLNPNSLDPLLTALGNYGGPTQVHMLKANSPAKDGVVGNDAPGTDQRGLPRPGPDGSYDIGAVERQDGESDLAPTLYLPLIVR